MQPAWVARARAAARGVADRAAASSAGADDASAKRHDDGAAPAPPALTLTVLTWNLQLLSVSVGTPAQLAARASRVADKLLSLSADVVCLQEVWDAAARGVLLRKLGAAYAHVYAPADGARCGLVLAAKAATPLRGACFHRFAGAKGAEGWLFDKGAAGGWVLLPDEAAAPTESAGGDDGDSDSCAAAASRHKPRGCMVLVNTHTQSDYWAPSERARAAQVLELRAFFGRVCGAAEAAGLAVRGALIVGDLNCAAGSAEGVAALATLRAPHTVDLAEPHAGAGACADDATFPLGRWERKRGAYARDAAPSARLDFILDASASANRERTRLAHVCAYVERGIAEDDDGHEAASFQLLSDHAAVLATVAV